MPVSDAQYVVVPREPTEAMWKAGSEAHEAHERPFTRDAIQAGWSAMIAATQQAPGGEGGVDTRREAWNDFEGDYLTDGNGYASADVYRRCRDAFAEAWPRGQDAALLAARATLVTLATPQATGEGAEFLGHLIVPKSGVGAVFVSKGEGIPIMGGKGRVVPVYAGPQNVTADGGSSNEGVG